MSGRVGSGTDNGEGGGEAKLRMRSQMEKAKEYLSVPEDEAAAISRLAVRDRPAGSYPSFYESFGLRGLRVDRVEQERGLVACTFTVPTRLTDKSGNLAPGAIANLVDEVGYALLHVEGLPFSVSVNMSISYLSAAKAGDELEITSKILGQKGSYGGTLVLLRNKENGRVIAEGRHSMFRPRASKL